MKREKSKVLKKAVQQDEDRWINVHDDKVMREMGFPRPSIQSPRDESVWSKTISEKITVRKFKHMFKQRDGHFHGIPKQTTPVVGKLIITLMKNKYYPKTTYSMKCKQHEIPDILAKFKAHDKKSGIDVSVVKKYYWNGKTYDNPSIVPIWRV
jgi:hypothetical protein